MTYPYCIRYISANQSSHKPHWTLRLVGNLFAQHTCSCRAAQVLRFTLVARYSHYGGDGCRLGHLAARKLAEDSSGHPTIWVFLRSIGLRLSSYVGAMLSGLTHVTPAQGNGELKQKRQRLAALALNAKKLAPVTEGWRTSRTSFLLVIIPQKMIIP